MRKPEHADYTDFASLAEIAVPILIAEACVMAGLYLAVIAVWGW